MYSRIVGKALNYGQSMVPGKAGKPSPKTVQKAVLGKKKKK